MVIIFGKVAPQALSVSTREISFKNIRLALLIIKALSCEFSLSIGAKYGYLIYVVLKAQFGLLRQLLRIATCGN